MNLLSSANLPILILSNDLHIRHATPAAEKLLNLIPTDVGRPVSDIKPNLRIENFHDLITEAIDTVTVKEREVEDSQGRWYSMRVRPYKTVENKIDGAVVVWIDISTIKLNAELVANYALELVDKIDESILVLDDHLRVKKANSTYYSTFEATADRTVNKFIYDLGRGRWSDPALRRALEEVLPKHTNIKDFELIEAGDAGRRTLLSARRLDVQGMLMVLVTVKVLLERPLQRSTLAERHQPAPDSGLVGIFKAATAGKVLECNETFAAKLGYESPSEVVGLPSADLDGSDSEYTNLMTRLKQESKAASAKVNMRRKDGSMVPLLLSAVLVGDEAGSAVIQGVAISLPDDSAARKVKAPQG